MKAKALNLKNMKETLVNYCEGNQVELDKIWHNFYEMACLGFISMETWRKFFDQCKGWMIDGDYLIDSENHDKIIFDFDNGNRGNGEYQVFKA